MKSPRRLSRREFVKGVAASIAAGTSLVVTPATAKPYDPSAHWWGFAVDLEKCIGCGACVRACRAENAVPQTYYRTWVERYTFLKNGEVIVDSPEGAEHGFNEDPDTHGQEVVKSFFVPKLCNHCENPPCVQVCPVGASYMTRDGVTLVDRKHCIGCGYCVQACPYGVRYIHPEGFADKCTLCYHRITKGLPTACVQACPTGARMFGDLRDPDSEINKLLGRTVHGVLKPDLGTHPKCYYVGLDQEVR